MSGPAHAAVDAAYAAAWAVLRHLPERVARRLFDLAAEVAWRRRGRGVRRLEANLVRACPELDADGLRVLSRRALRSYLRYWCEAFRLPAWDDDDIVSRVQVEGEDRLREAYAGGRGVVIALPHLANWDHAGAWASRTGMPVTTVAERLRPERLFDRFVAYRRRLGMRVIPLDGGDRSAFAELVAAARRGALVCLVADRDLSASGVEVTLLGEPASVPAGPAALARSTGAVLLPATLGYAAERLRITIHPAVEPVPGPDGLVAMTQRLADAFSAGIRRSPEDWHMLQRVFVADTVVR